jgi:hypothetical protein
MLLFSNKPEWCYSLTVSIVRNSIPIWQLGYTVRFCLK